MGHSSVGLTLSTVAAPIVPQPQFLDAVRARDVEAVEMWFEEGYKVLGESLMLAVRKGLFDINKVRAPCDT